MSTHGLSPKEIVIYINEHVKPMDTSKLKPFDMTAALNGEVVCTRDGEIITPVEWRLYKISIKLNDGKPSIYYEPISAPKNGVWHHIDLLFMAPKAREVWVNLYPFDNTPNLGVNSTASWHNTQEMADRFGTSDRLGNCAHKIVITE